MKNNIISAIFIIIVLLLLLNSFREISDSQKTKNAPAALQQSTDTASITPTPTIFSFPTSAPLQIQRPREGEREGRDDD